MFPSTCVLICVFYFPAHVLSYYLMKSSSAIHGESHDLYAHFYAFQNHISNHIFMISMRHFKRHHCCHPSPNLGLTSSHTADLCCLLTVSSPPPAILYIIARGILYILLYFAAQHAPVAFRSTSNEVYLLAWPSKILQDLAV